MSGKHALKICLLLCFLTSSLLACDGLPTIALTTTPPPSPQPTSTADMPFNTWITTAPGIEIRKEDWKSEGNNEDTIIITRFNLKQVHLSIGYQPDKPLTIGEWLHQKKVKAVINGGYFDQDNRPTGLLISNGNAFGSSYQGFGGMLSVDNKGHVGLRSLRTSPYSPGAEQLQQVTQSSPMLMIDGKRTQFASNAASQRRSVVATDTQGRLLFIVSPGQAFTLDELADLLAASDLSLKNALNLDGGASTGLYVNGATKVTVDAFTSLPIAILVK